MIGNRHEAFARHIELYTEFSNVAGIARGAKVPGRRHWMRARCREVETRLSACEFEGQIASTRNYADCAHRFRGQIGTEGVVGNRFVAISAGSPTRLPLPPQTPTLWASSLPIFQRFSIKPRAPLKTSTRWRSMRTSW